MRLRLARGLDKFAAIYYGWKLAKDVGKDGANFITSKASGVGSNYGGSIEVVTGSGNVSIEPFNTNSIIMNFFNQIELIKSILKQNGYQDVADMILDAQLSGGLAVKF